MNRLSDFTFKRANGGYFDLSFCSDDDSGNCVQACLEKPFVVTEYAGYVMAVVSFWGCLSGVLQCAYSDQFIDKIKNDRLQYIFTNKGFSWFRFPLTLPRPFLLSSLIFLGRISGFETLWQFPNFYGCRN